MPPDTKTNLISIQTLNQVIFDPPTKASQLWSLHWNQVNSDPPYWNHFYFDRPHNQVNFDANTKTMSFSGRFTLRVIHTSTCFLWYSSNTRTYNIFTSTDSYYSWRFHTPVKPRKCCVSIYLVPYFYFCYMVYSRLRVILVAGLRYVPFLLYVVVVLLGVIHMS